jgi:small-conductance mechanosensitive channel
MQDLISWWSSDSRGDILSAVIRGLIFLTLGWQLARLARHSFERSMARTAADASLSILVGRIIYLIVIGLGALTALDVLGVPLSSVVATLGIVGIAVSLAMQDILKSFFAGLYLLFERPFRIGDEIQLKDFVGRVEHINYRTTVILTAEGVRVLIPNATLMSEVVLNRGVSGPPGSPTASKS